MLKASSLVFVILAIIFLSQVYTSFNKYLRKSISKSISISKEAQIRMPSITVCPFPNFQPPSNRDSPNSLPRMYESMPPISEYVLRLSTNDDMRLSDESISLTEAVDRGVAHETVALSMWPTNTEDTGRCVTIVERSADPTRLTSSNLIFWMALNATFTTEYLIWVHQEGHFLPLRYSLFGNLLSTVGTSDASRGSSIYATYDIRSRDVEIISRPEAPCLEHRGSFATCIHNYFERELNCALPWKWYTGPSLASNLSQCRTKEEYAKFSRLGSELFAATDSKIYEISGCTLNCHRALYELNRVGMTKINTEDLIASNNGSTWVDEDYVTLFFSTDAAQIETEADFYTYDSNDLLGDIGGYLGLLLGFSIYSIVSSFEDYLRKVISRQKVNICQSETS